jgi:hypothetical protein
MSSTSLLFYLVEQIPFLLHLDGLEFQVEFILFFIVLTFVLGSNLPGFNVLVALCDLEVFDLGTYLTQLVEDGQHNVLDEPCLATCDVGRCSVAHH